MTAIRWAGNDAAAAECISKSNLMNIYLLRSGFSVLLGFFVSFFVMLLLKVGQGAVIIAFDIVAAPLGLLLTSLVFVSVSFFLMRCGYLGLIQSAVVAIVTGALGCAMAWGIISPEGKSFVGFPLTMVVNEAVTYGLLVGVLVWRAIAVRQPAYFLKAPGTPPKLVIFALAAAAVLVLWQLFFWFVVTGRTIFSPALYT